MPTIFLKYNDFCILFFTLIIFSVSLSEPYFKIHFSRDYDYEVCVDTLVLREVPRSHVINHDILKNTILLQSTITSLSQVQFFIVFTFASYSTRKCDFYVKVVSCSTFIMLMMLLHTDAWIPLTSIKLNYLFKFEVIC